MMSFDLEQFLGILEQYNLVMWPLHILASVLGIVAVFCAIKKTKHSDKIIMLILSLYWLWTGIVFCFMYWRKVYPFASVFGVLLVIQGIMFLGNSIKSKLSFQLRGDIYSIFGVIFLLYAMVGYSVLGQFLGHVYPRFFQFGLVPCPTTIYTFGLFLLTDKKLPKYLFVIPLLSSLSGILAVYWGIYEDIGLVITGLLGTYLILHRDKTGQD